MSIYLPSRAIEFWRSDAHVIGAFSISWRVVNTIILKTQLPFFFTSARYTLELL